MLGGAWMGQKWVVCCEMCLNVLKVCLTMYQHHWIGQMWIFLPMPKLGPQKVPFRYVKIPFLSPKYKKAHPSIVNRAWICLCHFCVLVMMRLAIEK